LAAEEQSCTGPRVVEVGYKYTGLDAEPDGPAAVVEVLEAYVVEEPAS